MPPVRANPAALPLHLGQLTPPGGAPQIFAYDFVRKTSAINF
jgi:hypothetical protein